MKSLKDGIRSRVRISYEGKVHKEFKGTDSDKRFQNEVKILTLLEKRGCKFVPKLLDSEPAKLKIITTNCGHPVERMSEEKMQKIFNSLTQKYGVRHDDQEMRNITYSPYLNRFCVIDFELAEDLWNGADKPPQKSMR